MKVKLIFFSRFFNKISINYQHFLTSMIYNCLSKADTKYSSELHNIGSYKFFTFSWLQIQNRKMVGSFIEIMSNEILWFVSSPSKAFMNTFVSGMLNVGYLRRFF